MVEKPVFEPMEESFHFSEKKGSTIEEVFFSEPVGPGRLSDNWDRSVGSGGDVVELGAEKH
ncbi:MAG: hypothetical protein V1736_01015 [Pseudomonadota bacterium]